MPLATLKLNTIYCITAIHVNCSSNMACIIILCCLQKYCNVTGKGGERLVCWASTWWVCDPTPHKALVWGPQLGGLSLHLVTFSMFFIHVHVPFFSSRCMLELKFAIYYRAASLPSQASYAVLAEESLTRPGFLQTLPTHQQYF